MSTEPDSAALIQKWIKEDKWLNNVLVKIQESGLSIKEQAERAFHKISDKYGLPKLPEDVQNDYDTSVYEELGLLKYLIPKNDPRGLVLMAIYFVKNKHHADDSEIDKSSLSGIGYKGENSAVELVLVQKGQSWIELGCKFFTKEA